MKKGGSKIIRQSALPRSFFFNFQGECQFKILNGDKLLSKSFFLFDCIAIIVIATFQDLINIFLHRRSVFNSTMVVSPVGPPNQTTFIPPCSSFCKVSLTWNISPRKVLAPTILSEPLEDMTITPFPPPPQQSIRGQCDLKSRLPQAALALCARPAAHTEDTTSSHTHTQAPQGGQGHN